MALADPSVTHVELEIKAANAASRRTAESAGFVQYDWRPLLDGERVEVYCLDRSDKQLVTDQ
jgi:RimJ/RimL family protein N-acetyltransferase